VPLVDLAVVVAHPAGRGDVGLVTLEDLMARALYELS
jgi:hypothetical protein